ncbi:MAG: ACT domain-containing protein [Desulfobacterales bacterium]|nr:ACT domain-containing protein [Desulfobacterales bacterium]
MRTRTLSLKILPEQMAVCRFDSTSELPDWIDQSAFYSITRTQEELTIVCREALVPPGTKCERGWRCFRVQGVLDFSEIGIMFSITQPLAKSGVSVFVISTYDTDYFLVKEKELPKAIDALTAAGHQIVAG